MFKSSRTYPSNVWNVSGPWPIKTPEPSGPPSQTAAVSTENGSVSSLEIKSNHHATSFSILAGILAITLISLTISGAVHAQVLYGSLTGNVSDQKGAAVPGAKVEVVNVSTWRFEEHDHGRTRQLLVQRSSGGRL